MRMIEGSGMVMADVVFKGKKYVYVGKPSKKYGVLATKDQVRHKWLADYIVVDKEVQETLTKKFVGSTSDIVWEKPN